MPLRQIIHNPKEADFAKLRDRLAEEWRNPQDDIKEPIILEEGEREKRRRPSHLYVIWDEWDDLDQLDRSEIIMNAFELTHGQEDILDITVAMGLTFKEAQRMGIEYAPLDKAA